jgi:hypothetical protein
VTNTQAISGRTLPLLLYGRSGTSYVLQSATNLSPGAVWVPAASLTLTNSFRFLERTNAREPARFFRVLRP